MSDDNTPDAIERFIDLVLNTRFEDLPPEAVAAGKTFFLDTVGVACAGALAPNLQEMLQATTHWGGGTPNATVWNSPTRTNAPVAALLNGYQCHALEYDCVYEPGVILPAAPIFSTLVARAEAMAAEGRPPHGRDLLRAFIVAVEVSCTLGLACRAGMIFFRPGTTGVFSALAAAACLTPLPREQLRHAFGIGYSQMGGSMQAHEEGSMMLATQMGFASRNALVAFDMAKAGITGPVQVLEGRFGFFRNYEHGHDLPAALAQLGMPWKVTQLSHKPFPSGRVTHGAIHTLRQLRKELGLSHDSAGDAVRAIRFRLPPLGVRLVGRPMVHSPAPNYARLCIPFVAATELLYGEVDPASFTSIRLEDPAIEALARKIEVLEESHPNPNAFYPQHVRLELADGRVLDRAIPHAWGHPESPLTAAEGKAKFMRCVRLSRGDAARADAERILAWLDRLEEAPGPQPLLDFLRGA